MESREEDSSKVKSQREDYNTKFGDASEKCNRKWSNGKQSASSHSNRKSRNSNSASSSNSILSIFNSCSNNKINRRTGGSNSSSSTYKSKNDSFGSTTSLDRRKHSSLRTHSTQPSLQPISDANRTLSLDRRKLHQYSPYGSNASLSHSISERRRKDRSDHHANDRHSKSKHAGENNEKQHRSSFRPKSSHPNLNPVDSYSSSKTDCLTAYKEPCDNNLLKRCTSKSPHRKSSKSLTREDDKERIASVYSDDKRRGRSLKRQTSNGSQQWNNNNL